MSRRNVIFISVLVNAALLAVLFLTAIKGDLESDGSYIDMENISYMDSSGIGALVASKKKMKANNSHFALLKVTEDVLNILKLATLDRFFTIYESEDELSS